ncbi:hypothetical protein [Vibrio spartinae]|uniref:NADH dehydrogenase subunit II-related protein n=1 Tax=Vibrio spartinae TaxID=1918945 RepID=A0A1N6M7Y8_9VIBR|nr:hypothetical protein [Vibrio spartinae]QMV12831.1 hypothetical protein Vspart_00023 [Vibrio spartinae]SIO95539.1 hypothetical protein VSP9026_03286 [Vibrio spartinae]
MLVRYTGMSLKSQFYLYSFGFILTVLGMILTDMWLPMVVGALILMGLIVESWIHIFHLVPLHQEIRSLKKQMEKLQHHYQDEKEL